MGIALALLCAAVGWEGTLKTEGTPFDGPPDQGVKASGSGWKIGALQSGPPCVTAWTSQARIHAFNRPSGRSTIPVWARSSTRGAGARFEDHSSWSRGPDASF